MSDVRSFAWIVVACELLAGCLPGEAGSSGAGAPDEVGTGEATSAFSGPTCPDFGCGANSPTLVDGVAFDELDAAGAPDHDGIQIVAAVQSGVPVMLHVDRHTMTAVATDGSGIVFAHGGLVGTVVTLKKAGQTYGLKIAGVDENSLRFWAGSLDEVVPFYRILVSPPGTQEFKDPVCRKNVAATEKVWAPVEHSALAFAGDRYEPVSKRVANENRGTTWFNLACAGSATAKLHLMRHTNAGAWTPSTWHPGSDVRAPGAPFHTDVAQRQAMLKMFAADYCGTGQPFTVDGQPLLYDDSKHWFAPGSIGVLALSVAADGSLSPSGAKMEALWTDQGALCVNQPRLVARTDVPCLTSATPLPVCKPDLMAVWDTQVHVISVNPP
ncbi:MAG TPA: ADYC domain-containing protein [Kofleriaceae bacterium]|jgi:hypothetical protein|nr:ADYC domain-containing protein [Kofleriaceae bacterium]